MLRRPCLALLFALLGGLVGRAAAQGPAHPVSLTIAAAGDLRGVLEELKGRFETLHAGTRLQLSYGASGSLAAQIQQGAPFDVFLSADTGFAEQVQRAGLATGEPAFVYATGCLVLWVRQDLQVDPAAQGLRTLLNPGIRKIATANPATAPYGRVGEAALKQAGLLEVVKPRLVFGDNIAQAAQFLQTGAAEAGLVSFSQANHPALRTLGTLWKVPADAHPPLRQAGVILKRTAALERARAFRAFLLGAEGQAILARHGFGRP